MPIYMTRIPEGYRELNYGELIEENDKISRGGTEPFKHFRPNVKYLGKPYKDINTPLLQETIIVRKIKNNLQNINIICDITRNIQETISQIRNHPVFGTQYRHSISNGYRPCYLYIITNYLGSGNNTIGTYDNKDDSTFQCCKLISYEDLLDILYPKDSKDPILKIPINCSLRLDAKLVECSVNEPYLIKT